MLTFFFASKARSVPISFRGLFKVAGGYMSRLPEKIRLGTKWKCGDFFQANPKGLQALTLYPKAGFLRPKKGIGTPGTKTTGGRFGDGKDTPEILRKRKKDSPVCEAIP